MYCLFCGIPCIVCMYMCTEQLPPGGYPIAVNYIIINIYCIITNQASDDITQQLAIIISTTIYYVLPNTTRLHVSTSKWSSSGH
jgi:hypothetical protein